MMLSNSELTPNMNITTKEYSEPIVLTGINDEVPCSMPLIVRPVASVGGQGGWNVIAIRCDKNRSCPLTVDDCPLKVRYVVR